MSTEKTWLKVGLFLLLIFFMLFLYTWRAKICFNPDELFYYKSSQTLSEFKNLYAPKYFEEHRFQKPPLFYLAVYLSFKLFGVNWFSARLVTVFSSILVLIMTYLLGAKMFDREKAFFGMGIFATTVLFFRFGRIVLPEMTLIFFMIGALYFAYAAFLGNKSRLFYLSFLFMAIGSLVKGPIAFLLPILVIFVFRAVNRKEISSISVPWFGGFLIILGLNLLWLIPTLLIYGEDFLNHIMTAEVGSRLTDKVHFAYSWQYARHYFQKVSFYVPVTFAQFLPWSALGPVALLLARGKFEKKEFFLQRSFLAIWFLAGFLIFTAVPAKRAHYVLLLLPALSFYLVSFFDFGHRYTKRFFRIFLSATIAVYLIAAIIVFPYIFIDGVDRLSIKLEEVLKEKDAPVAVSWRLDPQEVELYIDQPVHVIYERNFREWKHSDDEIEALISEFKKGPPLFYFMLAEKEYAQYLNGFLSYVQKAANRPVRYSTLSKDWRWSKTIYFKDFLYNIVKTPRMIISHFKDTFQEEVFLLAVRKE